MAIFSSTKGHFLSCRSLCLALTALLFSLLFTSQFLEENVEGLSSTWEATMPEMSQKLAEDLLRDPKRFKGSKKLHERVVKSVIEKGEVLSLDHFLFKLPGVKRKLLRRTDIEVVGKLLASNKIAWNKVLVQFNHMGDKGIRVIADGLGTNKFVKSLYLEGNDLTDECTDELFDALEQNGQMEMIHIDFNAFTDASIPRICTFIKRTKTVKLLDVSFNKFSKLGKGTLKAVGKQYNVSVWAHMTAPF